jgi:hypothetical protein
MLSLARSVLLGKKFEVRFGKEKEKREKASDKHKVGALLNSFKRFFSTSISFFLFCE